MNINIHVDTMREAERLSAECNHFPYEMYLRTGKFCVDPKSVLGVLAMMYTDKRNLTLDTGDMPDKEFNRFTMSIRDFINSEE